MLSPRFLPVIFVTAGYAAAAGLRYSVSAYGRQDSEKKGVTVSSIALRSVETSALEESTTFETDLGDGSSLLLGSAVIQGTSGAGELATKNVETSESTDTTTYTDMVASELPYFSSSPGAVKSSIANPTYCEVARGSLTPEEEVQLKVLFSDRAGASAFADYVVSYASKLVSEIDSVANVAVGYTDYGFTTAFENVDYTGILGLASAAPIYTCFLSSLWAEALSNPQQYAKGTVLTQDENIKLIVLFEKRANDGMQFDYAELLADKTNDLIAEIQSISAAAAANGDLVAYASLFADVDVPYFLSIASGAPIYTEGLSAAFESALASYNQKLHPTVAIDATTTTTTTVGTYVTNHVTCGVTIPTTVVATQTLVVVCNDICQTYTIVVNCDVVCTTETLSACIPPECTSVVGAPGATAGPNTVQTHTTAIEAAVTTTTTRSPSVVVYSQVQNGVTLIHTIEVQNRDASA